LALEQLEGLAFDVVGRGPVANEQDLGRAGRSLEMLLAEATGWAHGG
jgi:hypothetical protein